MSDSDLKVTDRRWWVNSSATETSADGAEAPKLKPTYIEELEARLAAKDKEIQELLTKYRGVTEEFDQARARLRKEVTKDLERGRRSLIASFLDVLDNLDRALAAATNRADDPLVQGVSLVRQQFLSTLDGLGVVRIDPLGHPFDPSRHEAAATVGATPEVPAGHVAGVIRPGYLVGDEVLRPAMVAVSG
jgi:molecular chaperone GrpE